MEAFGAGQKGSSAMPHKRNPILSENLTGLARLVRGWAEAAMDNVPLWHERDISHSSVERVIGPDATVTTHFMLARLRGLIEGLVVFPEQMAANLADTQGIWAAQRVMLALIEAGLSREAAYAQVQAHAMSAWNERRPLIELLSEDPELTALIPTPRLAELADAAWFTRRAALILDRVFQSAGS